MTKEFIHEQFRVTCEAAPLQIDGTYHGHSFYFRARHGVWALHSPNPFADFELENMTTAEATKAMDAYNASMIGGGPGEGFTVATAIHLIRKTFNAIYDDLPCYA